MKPQDLLFFGILFILLILRKTRYAWHIGLGLLFLAGILFLSNNLFTSQRCSWYAAGFLAVAVSREALQFFSKKK